MRWMITDTCAAACDTVSNLNLDNEFTWLGGCGVIWQRSRLQMFIKKNELCDDLDLEF